MKKSNIGLLVKSIKDDYFSDNVSQNTPYFLMLQQSYTIPQKPLFFKPFSVVLKESYLSKNKDINGLAIAKNFVERHAF